MIIITNKKTNLKKDEKEFITYADLIISCVNYVPREQGLNVSQMRGRIKIVDACVSAKKEIHLEDADAKALGLMVENMKWALIHQDIIAFCDYIKDKTK